MDAACAWMVMERRLPTSLRKVSSGIHMKLSWLSPKILPLRSATPTTRIS